MERRNSHLRHVSGVYKCENCGKMTRETGACESHVDLCRACYDAAGLENDHSDGHHDAMPESECPLCKAATNTNEGKTMKPNTMTACNHCRRAPAVEGDTCPFCGEMVDHRETATVSPEAQAAIDDLIEHASVQIDGPTGREMDRADELFEMHQRLRGTVCAQAEARSEAAGKLNEAIALLGPANSTPETDELGAIRDRLVALINGAK